MHAERVEVIRRHDAAGCAFGPITRDAEGGPDDLLGDERLDQRAPPPEILEVRPGDVGAFRRAPARAAQHEQPVEVCDLRIGTQQNAFDPAEDGSIRADAEREAQNCENGYAGTAAEHANADAEVLPHDALRLIGAGAETVARTCDRPSSGSGASSSTPRRGRRWPAPRGSARRRSQASHGRRTRSRQRRRTSASSEAAATAGVEHRYPNTTNIAATTKAPTLLATSSCMTPQIAAYAMIASAARAVLNGRRTASRTATSPSTTASATPVARENPGVSCKVDEREDQQRGGTRRDDRRRESRRLDRRHSPSDTHDARIRRSAPPGRTAESQTGCARATRRRLRSARAALDGDRRARRGSECVRPRGCGRSGLRPRRRHAWPSPRIARIAAEMLVHCRRLDSA